MISLRKIFLIGTTFVLFATPVAAARQECSQLDVYGHQRGTQLERHLSRTRLAILPMGSIEFHGPSGPLLTDSIIAEGIASRLGSELGASILPVLSFTHAPSHSAAHRGTLSVRPEVVTMLLEDILRGLIVTGFDKILLLNGHDGNIGPARGAMSQVTQEFPESQVLLINWWETLPTPEVEALGLFTSGNGGHGHGGPLELSVVAAFKPQLVEPGAGPDLPALTSPTDFPYYLEKKDTAGWPGYSGKLSEISGRKGEQLVEVTVRKIAGLINFWIENDSEPGSW